MAAGFRAMLRRFFRPMRCIELKKAAPLPQKICCPNFNELIVQNAQAGVEKKQIRSSDQSPAIRLVPVIPQPG